MAMNRGCRCSATRTSRTPYRSEAEISPRPPIAIVRRCAGVCPALARGRTAPVSWRLMQPSPYPGAPEYPGSKVQDCSIEQHTTSGWRRIDRRADWKTCRDKLSVRHTPRIPVRLRGWLPAWSGWPVGLRPALDHADDLQWPGFSRCAAAQAHGAAVDRSHRLNRSDHCMRICVDMIASVVYPAPHLTRPYSVAIPGESGIALL